MKFGVESVFSANLIWLCYFDLEFGHLGASAKAKALSPCPLQCTLCGACSSRSPAGGVCSPPDMWVFKQGASRTLSRCACGKQCITGHVFGCWLAGWVCVRECGFIRLWDTRRSQGARPTTCTLARRTRGWNICICVSDGSEREKVKYGYDIKIQFRRLTAFSIIRGKQRWYFLFLRSALTF